jgi:hypothetical protein
MIMTSVGYLWLDRIQRESWAQRHSIQQSTPMQNWFDLSNDCRYDWIFPAFFSFYFVVVFGTAFIMDALVSQILALDEHTRNFIYFLSTQILLWYCPLLNTMPTSRLQSTARRSVVTRLPRSMPSPARRKQKCKKDGPAK